MRWTAAILSGAMLAGCTAVPAPEPRAAVPIPFRSDGGGTGLNAVLGRNANQLVAQFGAPSADVREGPGRKLQFAGPICILDAYLYARGNAQPVVTYVDARQADGSPIDKASCVGALQRRSGAR